VSRFFVKSTLCALSIASIVFFQGCGKIQELVDYLSPNRKPVPPVVQKEASQPQVQALLQTAEQADSQAVQQKKEAAVKQELAPGILARVGDWTLALSEFNEQISELQGVVEGFDPKNVDQKKYILGEMIQQQLLVQAALKAKMDQSKEAKLAMEDFRNNLLAQLFVQKAVEGIQVTDQELETFYEENKKDIVSPFEWRVRELVVDSEDKAKEILVELNQGASFEAVAKTKSISESAAQGGDLGFLTTFAFEKMEQIVTALDEGAVSGSFKGPQGVYIVKLVEKRGGEIQEFDAIKEDLKAYLLAMKQQQAVFNVLADVQKEIPININEQLLEE